MCLSTLLTKTAKWHTFMPLHAAYGHSISCIRFLLGKYARIDLEFKDGQVLLDLALYSKSLKLNDLTCALEKIVEIMNNGQKCVVCVRRSVIWVAVPCSHRVLFP